jgi:multidrug efflux system membrane fusion protein
MTKFRQKWSSAVYIKQQGDKDMSQWSKNVKVLSGLGAIVLVIGLLLGMMLRKEPNSKSEAEDILLVKTQTVNRADTGQSFTYSGVVRGRYQSQLGFQVGGKIVGRNVELGSIVKPGDILMRIDPLDIKRGEESANAQVAAVESQYQLAKDNLARYGSLYKKGLISDLDYDNAKSAYDRAAAMLRQAKAQRANSQSMVNYCNLVAGAAGVVTSISAEVGQVVGAGQPVVTLVRDNEKEVEINVPENRLTNVRNATQLNIKFWALPNTVVTGRIREVAPMADQMSHTYLMRVSLINPPSEVKLGMTAEAQATDSSETQAILVPLSAIYQTGDTPAVWVVNNGIVKLRAVKVGEFGDDKVQILNGLQNGDVIVIAGVHKLRAGQKVRIGAEV